MHIHRRLEIDCSPKTLWRCLTDADLLKQWISNLVETVPDDPNRARGVGSSATLHMRQGAKILSYRSLVTEWEPDTLLAIRLSEGALAAGMEIDVRYEISQENVTGTVLDYDVTVPFKGLLFKLLSPLIRLAAVANTKRELAKLRALASEM